MALQEKSLLVETILYARMSWLGRSTGSAGSMLVDGFAGEVAIDGDAILSIGMEQRLPW